MARGSARLPTLQPGATINAGCQLTSVPSAKSLSLRRLVQRVSPFAGRYHIIPAVFAPPSTRMYFGRRTPMPVSFKDILEALEFVSAGGMGEHQAFLCKQSGRVYWHSEFSDELDELPDDIEDSEKYVPIPDKRELDLGKPLVLDFARQFLPNDIDEVRQIFSRKGAYARFKDLLDRRGALDHWYDFEAKVEEKALRMWCDLNSIEVGD